LRGGEEGTAEDEMNVKSSKRHKLFRQSK